MVENEGTLQRMVDEFDRVCKKRQLKENLGKSKVFEKAREQVINFENPSRTTAASTVKCRIRLGEERMEEGSFI